LAKAKLWNIIGYFTALLYSASRHGRSVHRDMDAECILEKTGGTKSCTFSRKLGKIFNENVDPTFIFIVTAGKNRDLIMHVG
jgi:hypothetical protein